MYENLQPRRDNLHRREARPLQERGQLAAPAVASSDRDAGKAGESLAAIYGLTHANVAQGDVICLTADETKGNRRGLRRHHRNRLLANFLLQFQPEPVFLHLEHGKIVLPHQIDDGFDIFEFHGARDD